MWNKTKSLMLSRIMTAAMTGMLVILMFFIPSVSFWYEDVSVGEGFFGGAHIAVPLIICLYIGEILALTAMYMLHRLLRNIDRGEVFIAENTRCLRVISWACMMAGADLAVFGMWRFIAIIPAFLAVMFGLVMRVLKNVFEKAVEIKSENDFTI